jgi:DNA polymerase III subunit alpha
MLAGNHSFHTNAKRCRWAVEKPAVAPSESHRLPYRPAMAIAPFVPLRVFSSYTLLDGAIDPKGFARLAKERGFPAIAITDRNGLYGAMPFASACKEAGIQPILGTFLAVKRGDGDQIDWLGLLAQDEAGWNNLCCLVSRAHLARPVELDPHVPLAELEGLTDGLICLSGAGEGAMARLLADGKSAAAADYCARLEALFPQRLYIELARRNNTIEEAAEEGLIALAYARDLPLVATNPANFAEPGFHAAHDAMLCIAASTHLDAADRPRSARENWVKSQPMMAELFADLPEALANTLVVAQRCAVAPPKRTALLPSLAGDTEGEAAMLAEQARSGLEARIGPYGELSPEERQAYFDRLDFEIGVINGMGFAGYFLIVADFIIWAKQEGIPVGPGRGSS